MDITSYLLGKQAGGGSTPTGEIPITENGVTNVSGYATANVNVQPDLESKSITITENTTTTITPTQGKDGMSSVEVTTNVPTGSGSVEEKDVDFIDYDGTLLYSYTKDEFLALTAMPENPSHEGLTAQGWNWTLSDAKTYVTDYGMLVIGQLYVTTSGLTEIDIELNQATGKSVDLKMSGTKNWGDGTSDTNQSHTYTNYGTYTITCDGKIGTNVRIFGQTNQLLNSYVKNIRLMSDENIIQTQAFEYCRSLKTVILKNKHKYLGDTLFNECRLLKAIVLPTAVEQIGSSEFYNCTNLEIISIAKTIPSVGSSTFNGCSKLRKIALPEVTSVPGSYLINCYALERVVLPKTITSFGSGILNRAYSMKEYDFSKYTSVPSLGDNNVFGGINQLCRIIIPDALYSTWISAQYWSNLSSQIVKASEA